MIRFMTILILIGIALLLILDRWKLHSEHDVLNSVTVWPVLINRDEVLKGMARAEPNIRLSIQMDGALPRDAFAIVLIATVDDQTHYVRNFAVLPAHISEHSLFDTIIDCRDSPPLSIVAEVTAVYHGLQGDSRSYDLLAESTKPNRGE